MAEILRQIGLEEADQMTRADLLPPDQQAEVNDCIDQFVLGRQKAGADFEIGALVLELAGGSTTSAIYVSAPRPRISTLDS